MRKTSLALALASMIVGGTALSEPTAEKGSEVYTMFCVTCHGTGGKGDGVVGKTLKPPPRDFTVGDFKYGGTDQDIFDVISNGAAPMGGSPLMVAWSGVLSESDRWGLVKYIHSLRK